MRIPLPLLLIGVSLAGCAMEPKAPPDQPFALEGVNVASPRPSAGWTLVDRRPTDRRHTQQMDPGRLVMGDELLQPHPNAYVRNELLRAIYAHPARELIDARLMGKELSLLEFEVSLGTRAASPPDPKKLVANPPFHSSRADAMLYSVLVRQWEVVRVRLLVRIDDQVFESSDVHPYVPEQAPSPASIPAATAVGTLVNQMYLFWRE